MDNMTTRVIIIGVNIFVTLTIVSLVMITFFQMKEIYGVTGTTDTSIYNRFDDIYSMYDGNVESGVGLLNTIKKFEDEPISGVTINYPNADRIRREIKNANASLPEESQKREATYLKDLMANNRRYYGVTYRLEDRYNVKVLEGSNAEIIINFEKINI